MNNKVNLEIIEQGLSRSDFGRGRPYYNKQCRDKIHDRFYIYIHRRISDNKPFYVGKGCGSRAWTTCNRNKHWTNVANKYGYYFEILFDNLSEDESLQVEVDTILEFKYFGYLLTNKTEGGDGISGHKFSDESKLRMSIAQRTSQKVAIARKINSEKRLGITIPQETKIKMSLAQKGKPKSEEHRVAASSAKRIKTVYTFIHLDGRTFTGTRYDFSVYSELDCKVVSSLFGSYPNKTTKGWQLSS